MDEAYAVFDTLSIGEAIELAPSSLGKSGALGQASYLEQTANTSAPRSAEVAPVLASTPHIAGEAGAVRASQANAAPASVNAAPAVAPQGEPQRPAAPRRDRIDARGSEAHPHTWAGRDVVAQTAADTQPAAATQPSADTRSAADAVTIGPNQRIDPAPTTALSNPSQSNPSAVAQPLPAEQAVANAEPRPEAAAPLAATLLQIDALVSPYARWIALAAVIAAIGLTMVLLGGGRVATQGDTPGATVNQAQEPGEQSVFAQLDPLGPITPKRVPTPTAEATTVASAPVTAAGPASAPRLAAAPTAPSAPVLRLTGEVIAPAGPTPQIAPTPQMAQLPAATNGYPRTATYPTTNGSTRR